ncbi:hypothetical protein XI09_18310 [Bradyrhizobium sp. CCBAU 11386]|nr:hypothetical protein [Bradyrhizobium sp. CCBAU 11386]
MSFRTSELLAARSAVRSERRSGTQPQDVVAAKIGAVSVLNDCALWLWVLAFARTADRAR